MNCCRSNTRHLPDRQRGAALLIALFVLAVAMVVVTGLSTSAVIAARRAENQILADQAWYYLIGVEELAIELLKVRRRELAAQPVDERAPMGPIELFGRYDTDHGWIAFTVGELQGRFNLNALRRTGPPAVLPDIPNSLEQRRFVRLLLSLAGADPDIDIDIDQAVALTEALIDWLDGDQLETGFGGAELPAYVQRTVPYRPADGALRDVSELLLVSGFTPALVQALEPHVTVWPLEGAAINVASASTNVIQALAEDELQVLVPLPVDRAEALREAVRNGEIGELSEFLIRPEWGVTPLAATNLVDRSDLFVISSQTRVGRIEQALDSVIQITDNQVRLLARSLRIL